MPFGANDLSLFAAADAAIRARSLTRRCRRATKRAGGLLLVEESIIKREGEFTLNLAADVENFTALPAGYEIARRQRNVGWCRPGPLSSFPTPGSPPASAQAVAPRRCPSSPATSLRKHHD